MALLCACLATSACSGSNATIAPVDGGADADVDDAGTTPDGPIAPTIDAGPIDAAAAPDATCVPCPECAWELETVDTGAGEFASMARGSDGTLHVAYEELSTGRLKHAARLPTGGWSFEVVDSGSSRYASMAVDSDGGLHIAYQWQMPGRLRYAHRGPGDEFWELTTVAEGGETGRYPSLGVTPDGTAHIAYFDETNADVDYAWHPAGGSWSTESIATTGLIGLYPSLAPRPDNQVDVVYWEPTPADLHLAEGSSGSWTFELPDDGVNEGPYPKIVIGPDGTEYIAYVDTSSIEGVMRFAQKPPGGIWTWNYVIDCCDSGYHIGFAIDPDNGVHMSYYHNGSHDLKYAYRPPGDVLFTITPVATAGNVGEYTSLVYAPDHSVHITYFDRGSGALGHATRPGRCM